MVTGSNGLLGQKLVYALKQIPAVDLLATSRGANKVNDILGYSYLELDITNQAQVHKAIIDFAPHALIHTAAMTNVDKCETAKTECELANVDATRYIIAALEQCSLEQNEKPHLVHLSTDFIFDGLAGPYREEDKPNPISHYGESKLKAEQLVSASALHWSIIRTIIIYGVIDDRSRSNIVLWVKNSLEQSKPINVINDQFRAPTLAEDLADACIQSILRKAYGVFHVSGPDTYCISEMVQMIADRFALDRALITEVSSAALNQPAARPPHTGFIIDKAKALLAFHPHTFSEGLEVVAAQLK